MSVGAFRLFSNTPVPKDGPTNAFYQAWSEWLQPGTNGTSSMIDAMQQGVAHFFYRVTDAVDTAWQKAFDFGGFATSWANPDNELYKYAQIIFALALSAASIMMTVQLIRYRVTKGKAGKDYPVGIVVSIIAVTLLPWALNLGGQTAKTVAVDGFMQPMEKSIAIAPFQDNVLDMGMLASKDFNDDPKKIDPSKYNKLTADNLFVTPLQQRIGDDQKDAIKKMGASDDDMKVFDSKFNPDNPKGDVLKLGSGAMLTGDTFAESYPRYVVSWISIDVTLFITMLVSLFSTFSVLKAWFVQAFYGLPAIWFFLTDGAVWQRKKELWAIMQGSLVTIAMQPLAIFMFRVWLKFVNQTMQAWEVSQTTRTLLYITAMLAAFTVVMSGLSKFEEWTGASQNHGAAAQQFLAASSAARSVGGVAKGVGKLGMGAGRASAKLARNVPGTVKKVGNNMAKAGTGSMKLAGGVAEAVSHPVSTAEGMKNAGKNAITNGIGATKDKVKSVGQSITSNFDDGRYKMADVGTKSSNRESATDNKPNSVTPNSPVNEGVPRASRSVGETTPHRQNTNMGGKASNPNSANNQGAPENMASNSNNVPPESNGNSTKRPSNPNNEITQNLDVNQQNGNRINTESTPVYQGASGSNNQKSKINPATNPSTVTPPLKASKVQTKPNANAPQDQFVPSQPAKIDSKPKGKASFGNPNKRVNPAKIAPDDFSSVFDSSDIGFSDDDIPPMPGEY
ncbi:hypothetical protein EQG49_00255 [Periweissella cryptocerci]|uniref:DUF8208 domain-containing protein n=1 Tax=Periweissella cryptocerci TaxID=2506420 RepID=A0A4P6YQW8_9LACO|nr:hypothetical protein [Periweissella cryptocerci]QBO34986.1 hypothetical protein EQG49_00255 [Periweissella cryptocerci]